jgi:hypothetical protein
MSLIDARQGLHKLVCQPRARPMTLDAHYPHSSSICCRNTPTDFPSDPGSQTTSSRWEPSGKPGCPEGWTKDPSPAARPRG